MTARCCTRCGETSQRGCEDWNCYLGWAPQDTSTQPEGPALTPPALLDHLDALHAAASDYRLTLDDQMARDREQARYEIIRALPHLTAALRAALDLIDGKWADREERDTEAFETDHDEFRGGRAWAYEVAASELREAITTALGTTHPMSPPAPTSQP